MDKKSLQERLLEVLPKGKYSNNTKWYACKCPRCDQKPGNKKTHLAINLNEDEAITYKCWRANCNTGGVLNRSFGRKLGLPYDICNELESHASKYSRNIKNNRKYLNKQDEFFLPEPSKDAIDYFRFRTNHELLDLYEEFRITDNMTEFYNKNKINIDRKKIYFLLKKEKEGHSFIYFFNDSFSMCWYREIYGENTKGKLSLNHAIKGNKVKHKPYIIKREGTFHMSPDRDTLILAEGPFDIINSVLHVAPKHINAHFVMTGGIGGFLTTIREFGKYHFKPHVVVVSDNDVQMSWYRYYLLPKVYDRICELIILYNSAYKDVGDFSQGINMVRSVIYEYKYENDIEEEDDEEDSSKEEISSETEDRD